MSLEQKFEELTAAITILNGHFEKSNVPIVSTPKKINEIVEEFKDETETPKTVAPAPIEKVKNVPVPPTPKKAETPAAEEESVMTHEQLNTALKEEYVRLGNNAAAAAKIKETIPGGGISELNPEQYAAVLASVKAL